MRRWFGTQCDHKREGVCPAQNTPEARWSGSLFQLLRLPADPIGLAGLRAKGIREQAPHKLGGIAK